MKNVKFKILITLAAFLLGIASVWFAGGFSYLAFLFEPIIPQDIPQTREISVIPNSLDWDLTYTSVLEKNSVSRKEFLWKWRKLGYQGPFTRKELPAQKWIDGWHGEAIVSSILIEIPAGHAAEHINEWFVRTENHAYRWSLVEDNLWIEKKQELNPQLYDDLFAQVSSMQQGVPEKPEDLSTDTPPELVDFYTGYAGFLSIYNKGESRQILLTWQDFGICDSKVCCKPECGTLRLGRLFRALKPIFEIERTGS